MRLRVARDGVNGKLIGPLRLAQVRKQGLADALGGPEDQQSMRAMRRVHVQRARHQVMGVIAHR